MTDNYWPEDWNLRDRMEWRMWSYYRKARHVWWLRREIFGVEFWVMIATFVSGIVMFFLPELLGWLGS